jgi:hypothetical protein
LTLLLQFVSGTMTTGCPVVATREDLTVRAP